MSLGRFADIILPVKLDRKYTYLIPKDMSDKVFVGQRVLINFGKQKLYTGIIHSIHNDEPDVELKEILEVTDEKSLVVDKQISLWKWMSDYYCCSEGEILKAAVPSNLIPSSESEFYYNIESDYSGKLSDSENRIISFMQNAKVANLDSLASSIGIKNPVPQLQHLQQKGIILINQKIDKKYKPSLKTFLRYQGDLLESKQEEFETLSKRAKKQFEVLEYLISEQSFSGNSVLEIEVKELLVKFNTSLAALKSIEKKGFIELFQKEVTRFEFEDVEENKSPVLSIAQDNAYNSINVGFDLNKPVLLHGVTSSGKTEIYIRLIEEVIKKGKQALYMLPEIALTAQMIYRLRRHFGNRIGVYHSKYSLNNRSEVYQQLLNHELDVVLGVRSSIFLPFDNLGLIVVDEEHENSYKQQNPDPRYNARDIAIVLATIHKCKIILGSATPSVESYYNADSGKYHLVELGERYGKVELPKIQIVDIKDGYRRKIMKSHFHPVLYQAIEEALNNNEQVVLFQNRRGYAPYLECKDCGWVPQCDNCNVSMTYNKYGNQLVCHYCTDKKHIYYRCESCGSTNLTTKGLGTEQIVDEVYELFPTARVTRLDQDSAGSRKRFEKIIKDFENHNTDIIVGTQMVTKGLDFENLTLVGILNADNMLNFHDFRAFERSFQLLSQVSGRAGRRQKQGKVIVQTYTPNHLILKQVLENDFDGMFRSQLPERKAFKYPPYWNFIIIRLRNKDKQKLYKTANLLAENLRKDLYQRVLGPEEPLVNMVKRYFLLNIHIRFEKKISSIKIKKLIIDNLQQIAENKELASTKYEIDVDPL